MLTFMKHLYAMVDALGFVIGLVEWDGKSDLNRDTFTLVLAQGAQIGWIYAPSSEPQ
jgi:hypothetical protein